MKDHLPEFAIPGNSCYNSFVYFYISYQAAEKG